MKNVRVLLRVIVLSVGMTVLLGSAAFAGMFDFLKPGDEGVQASEQAPDPIDQLKGPAREEIKAIANLLLPGSGLMAIDLSKKTGQFCMLEGVSGRNMVHFSHKPERDQEDIIYFLNPETFIANGLDVAKLPPLPSELGEMVPFQWYYYDGTYVEPHHGRKFGADFLVMAVDVK